jgi:hypothetical protein
MCQVFGVSGGTVAAIVVRYGASSMRRLTLTGRSEQSGNRITRLACSQHDRYHSWNSGTFSHPATSAASSCLLLSKGRPVHQRRHPRLPLSRILLMCKWVVQWGGGRWREKVFAKRPRGKECVIPVSFCCCVVFLAAPLASVMAAWI